MKKKYFIFFPFFLLIVIGSVQSQCPGCIVDMNFTVSPAEPAIMPDTLPDGVAGQYYDADIHFYLPAQFTHSSGTNVTLTKLEVLSVAGLPFGLDFQSSSPTNTFFPSQNPPTTEHGCAKVCGTPIFPGQYNMVVFVRAHANTFIGTQISDDSFVIPITILPGSAGGGSFTVTNTIGCGSLTASFITNFPSNGHPGYTYAWDFGNGFQSSQETPSAITYNTPGPYQISCQTTIDTLNFNYLNSVTVLGVSCSDFGSAVDLYLKIKNQAGTLIHQTAMVLNTNPPVTFTLPGIQLFHNQTYTIEVWDEDGGLAGADDHCKTFQIPGNSASGSMWIGVDGISFETNRPVLIYNDTVTVHVYPQPETPVISVFPALSVCVNDSIRLTSTNTGSLQWYNDTLLLMGANQTDLWVYNTGKYFVVSTDNNGCMATSDTMEITFFANPPKPTFWRVGDSLFTILSGYSLQWYLDGNPITGATGQSCFIGASGNYSLIATTTQGCVSYSDVVYFVSSSIEETKLISDFVIYPNPNNGRFIISFNSLSNKDFELAIHDMLGRNVHVEIIQTQAGPFHKELVLQLAPSLYILDIRSNNKSIKRERIVVQ